MRVHSRNPVPADLQECGRVAEEQGAVKASEHAGRGLGQRRTEQGAEAGAAGVQHGIHEAVAQGKLPVVGTTKECDRGPREQAPDETQAGQHTDEIPERTLVVDQHTHSVRVVYAGSAALANGDTVQAASGILDQGSAGR
jgi:hypothetical protein